MCIQARQKNLYLILPWENSFLCALQSGIHITGSGYLPFGATQHLKHPPTFEELSYQMRHSPPCTIKAENDRQTLAQPSCSEVLAPNRVPLIRYSHPRLWFGSHCFKTPVTWESGGWYQLLGSRGSHSTNSHQGQCIAGNSGGCFSKPSSVVWWGWCGGGGASLPLPRTL